MMRCGLGYVFFWGGDGGGGGWEYTSTEQVRGGFMERLWSRVVSIFLKLGFS